ncbi:ADP-ribose pyrophosphatase YjhB, NUDIX family [Micromonospora phaseoli]|uniref:ADP-ribose pyrophosphatase YjhB, NUDIX family n=1 Tax=Micromonospora phaseoli TaxID=1144548 RepID=A0A1H7D4L0_9ACTN|nr:NUDIX hydrolase [Micromonospora phaseoli]PZV91496.1 ADP-ribose pyrophosphatase YjhB (NUDIX family) [Micromonospora phaseoli]GIJ80099.1 DNA mismatch repair protein MutT [Micromonospora phaseoli]SEJ93115.1 ADP-ribose pyrophosphatase YjhB, NUDIX family [Micromonospora phaseoli]
MRRIVRTSVRAILLDGDDRLVLIKRIKSGQVPYWTTPGGGVESTDVSLEAALRRELQEELGASADRFAQVFLFTAPFGDGVSVQHFFVCRLLELREDARTGPEFDDPSRGDYQVDRVTIEELPAVDLKPEVLTEFITSNKEALLSV